MRFMVENKIFQNVMSKVTKDSTLDEIKTAVKAECDKASASYDTYQVVVTDILYALSN